MAEKSDFLRLLFLERQYKDLLTDFKKRGETIGILQSELMEIKYEANKKLQNQRTTYRKLLKEKDKQIASLTEEKDFSTPEE